MLTNKKHTDNYNARISAVKAIAIILMVLGHTGFSKIGTAVIYSFHMPLFFFCSGYCFKDKYLDDGVAFLKKRICGLYLPFVFWSLIFLFLHNWFFRINLYSDQFGYSGTVSQMYTRSDIVQKLKMIVCTMRSNEQLLGAYWFLRSLFWASIISFACFKVFQKTWITPIFLFVVTCYLSHYGVRLPLFEIGKVEFYGAFFISTGRFVKKKGDKWIDSPWLLLGIPVLVLVAVIKPVEGMMEVYCSSILQNTSIALIGILTCFYITKLIPDRLLHVTGQIGDNTLPIVTFHFISFKLVSLIIIAFYGLSNVRLSEFPVIEEYSCRGWWILYLLVGVTIPLILNRGYLKLKSAFA